MIKNDIKKYYLVQIHTNWADEMDIDGYVIYNGKEYNRWKKGWDKIEGDSVNVSIGTNEDVDICREDFGVTELTEEQYKVFKKLDMLSFGHSNLFDAYEYYVENNDWEDEDDELDEEEEWAVEDKNIKIFVESLLGVYPTWEIPEEFKDKLVYIGRRYAILYIDEKIDAYEDERFLNALVQDAKIWNDEKKGWEYHIRLRPTQKPFYV